MSGDKPRESFVRGFFANRGEFMYDDKRDAFSQFHDLADYMNWDSLCSEDAHSHLQDALVLQFNAMYGTDETNLSMWQYVCQALQALPIPRSLDACKEHVLSLHFNVCDLVEAGWNESSVQLFATHQELYMYTLRSGKYFPPVNRFAGGLLKELVRLCEDKPQGRDHFIRSFFARYDDFVYIKTKDTAAQFQALANQIGWNESIQQIAYTQLLDVMSQQFNDMYGTDGADINSWRRLCQALQISPMPNEVSACQERIRALHFTLWDVVDAGRTGSTVKLARNRPSLLKYMTETGKYSPQNDECSGDFLKLVLDLCRHHSPFTRTGLNAGPETRDTTMDVPTAALKKSRPKHTFISNYFAQFPQYTYNDADETMSQFSNLQVKSRWNRKQYRQERAALQLALIQQFNQIYGKNMYSMHGWRELCRTMDLHPIPDTVAECAKIFEHTHVNLIDLVDCHRTGRYVHTFSNVVDLSEYTMDYDKFFPKELAEAGGLLQYLLRKILWYGSQYRDAPEDVRQACQT